MPERQQFKHTEAERKTDLLRSVRRGQGRKQISFELIQIRKRFAVSANAGTLLALVAGNELFAAAEGVDGHMAMVAAAVAGDGGRLVREFAELG